MREEEFGFLMFGFLIGSLTVIFLGAIILTKPNIGKVEKITKKCKENKLIEPPVSIKKINHDRRVDYLKACYNKLMEGKNG